MKRLLLAALGAAAVSVPAPAHAHHVCLSVAGGDTFCLPHAGPRPVCVSDGSMTVCVP